MVVSSMAILLVGSLTVMLYYSRKAVKEETLQKAMQQLEGTMQRVDNILLSVEQASGNVFFNLLLHLDEPEIINEICQQLVASNPYVAGCTIALHPDYLEKHQSHFAGLTYSFAGRPHYITYVQREADGSVNRMTIYDGETTVDYTACDWFVRPASTMKPEWLTPVEGRNGGLNPSGDRGPMMTFCIPISGVGGQPAGVLAVDLSLYLLLRKGLAVKSSSSSSCTILSADGTVILYPDSTRLLTNFLSAKVQEEHPALAKAVGEMLKGETDYCRVQVNGEDYFVFYKPFARTAVSVRAADKLGWTAGIIYPEDNISGEYWGLVYFVLAISFIGLLILFVLSRTIIHRQLLPLRLLTHSAQQIAEGHYDVQVPESRHDDEIGRLQNDFQQMQHSLSVHMNELEQLMATMQERGEELRLAYERSRKADKMKTAFLHHMTNQMVQPTQAIYEAVLALCEPGENMKMEEVNMLAQDIQQHGETIMELLKNLLNVSEEEIGKEVGHEGK